MSTIVFVVRELETELRGAAGYFGVVGKSVAEGRFAAVEGVAIAVAA
jgi:hypothetical protein